MNAAHIFYKILHQFDNVLWLITNISVVGLIGIFACKLLNNSKLLLWMVEIFKIKKINNRFNGFFSFLSS